MSNARNHRLAVNSPAVAMSVGCVLLALAGCAGTTPATTVTSSASTGTVLATVNVNPTSATTPIAPSFLGLSLVLSETKYIVGTNAAPNPYFNQLIKNLTANASGPFSIRELNDGPFYSSTVSSDMPALGNFYNAMGGSANTGVRYFVGLDFADNFDTSGNDNGTAATQAQTIATTFPTGSVVNFELGNEPDLYPSATPVRRTGTWTYATYKAQYALATAAIEAKNTGIKTGAPVFSGVNNSFFQNMPDFLTSEAPHIGMINYHYYGGTHCTGNTVAADYLLSDSAVDNSAYASQANNAYSVLANANAAGLSGVPIRIGEMNSVSCQGQSGVSDTFQSAIWFMDTAMGFAKAGVSGVNLFSLYAASAYSPFTFTNTGTFPNFTYAIARINPSYYGMLMTSQMLQSNAALLPLTINTSSSIKAYATKDSNGVTRVLLLNKSESADGVVTLNLSGHGNASVESLVVTGNNFASSDYTANTTADQITIGGQTFKGSTNGALQGTQSLATVTPSAGAYTVTLPHTSAAMVQIP